MVVQTLVRSSTDPYDLLLEVVYYQRHGWRLNRTYRLIGWWRTTYFAEFIPEPSPSPPPPPDPDSLVLVLGPVAERS